MVKPNYLIGGLEYSLVIDSFLPLFLKFSHEIHSFIYLLIDL